MAPQSAAPPASTPDPRNATPKLIPVDPVPTAPPVLTFSGGQQTAEAVLFTYDWSRVVGGNTHDPVGAPWPPPIVGDGERHLHWATSSRPVDININAYRTIDSQTGVPTGEPVIWQCNASTTTGCPYVMRDNRVDLPLAVTSVGQMSYLAVQVIWTVPTSQAAHPGTADPIAVATWLVHYP